MTEHIATDTLLDYLHGEIGQEGRMSIQNHLAQCQSCQAELDQWQALVGKLEAPMQDKDIPSRSVREIIVSQRKPRSVLPYLAAMVAAVLLTSPFYFPWSAAVLAQTPVIGPAFSQAVVDRGLAVAYQAGLVHELNRSQTDGVLTMTVVGAYADSVQTAVMIKMSGDSDTMRRFWADFTSPTNHQFDISLRDSFGREYRRGGWSGNYDEAAGEFNIVMKVDRMPFYIGHLKLQAHLLTRSLTGDWVISFPIQRVSDKMTQSTRLDVSFNTVDGATIHLDQLVFAPSRTDLHYSMAGMTDKNALHPKWSLLADGKTLQPLAGQQSGNDLGITGIAGFEPTTAREITVRFEGFEGQQVLNWRLPVHVGATTSWEKTTLTITRVDSRFGQSIITADMKGSFLKLDGLAVITQDGRELAAKVSDFTQGQDSDLGTYTFSVEDSQPLSGATLLISSAHGVKPESWSTTIHR